MVLSIGVLRCRTPSLVLCCAVLFAVLYSTVHPGQLPCLAAPTPARQVRSRSEVLACLLVR
ncbi:hypothetical protein FOXYSP1_01669 [Fusarium oxysporum f. sp. phaseoli]